MKTKMLLNFLATALVAVTSAAQADTPPAGDQTAQQDPFISLEAPAPADAYLPNILTPVLVTHSESQTNYARAVMNGWDAVPALVEGPALPARDGVNFSIELNEWHEPMRMETDVERRD